MRPQEQVDGREMVTRATQPVGGEALNVEKQQIEGFLLGLGLPALTCELPEITGVIVHRLNVFRQPFGCAAFILFPMNR